MNSRTPQKVLRRLVGAEILKNIGNITCMDVSLAKAEFGMMTIGEGAKHTFIAFFYIGLVHKRARVGLIVVHKCLCLLVHFAFYFVVNILLSKIIFYADTYLVSIGLMINI